MKKVKLKFFQLKKLILLQTLLWQCRSQLRQPCRKRIHKWLRRVKSSFKCEVNFENKWILPKKPFRELLLRTHREQLWQSCRIVSSKNSHNFSAQNPKSVKNRWKFHINQLSSKGCSGHVKPIFVKPAKNFPLECRKSFLKKRKRIKTLSSSFRKHLYSTCS